MQEQPKPTPPDVDGYLLKLKHKQSLLGSWNRRYFRVNAEEETLEYFRTKPTEGSDQRPDFSMPLHSITSVHKFDELSFQIESTDRALFLRAESAAEHSCWLEALQTYTAERQKYKQWRVAYEAQRSYEATDETWEEIKIT